MTPCALRWRRPWQRRLAPRRLAQRVSLESRMRRRGMTTLEIIAALPLLTVLAMAAIGLMLAVHRAARMSDTRLGASRELRHAVHILEAELRPLRADDFIAWSDSLVEFDAPIGTGVACDTRASHRFVSVLPPARTPASSAFTSTPQAGDVIDLWITPSSATEPPARIRTVVVDVSTALTCPAHPLRRGTAPGLRFSLRDSIASPIADGSPVRLSRRTRYALYLASDGLAYLGKRVFDGASWDAIQPVVGPLAPAREGGLRVDVLDSAGVMVPVGSAGAARIELRLRYKPIGPGPGDSTTAVIALRGADGARR